MAWRYIFKCDGCGTEKTENEDHVPNGWADISIQILGFSNMAIPHNGFVKRVTLCGACQHKLSETADPENWRVA